MNVVKLKKYVKKNAAHWLPYLVVFWLLDWLGQSYRLANGTGFITKLFNLLSAPSSLMDGVLFSFSSNDLLLALLGTLAVFGAVKAHNLDKKKFRKGKEYGEAEWGTETDIEPFIDPVFRKNILLTATERLGMAKARHWKYNRNYNVMVVGGSGTGKTRYFVKPNLMQGHSSYVVADPKGTVLNECGYLMQRMKYRIKVFNLVDFTRSMHYNPFIYLHSEKDILKLVTALIANTKKEDKTGGDQFWEDAERLLYCALIGYIHFEAPEEEQNMSTLIEMIDAMEVREDDDGFQNAVDLLFAELEENNPRHFALRQYKKYKLAAGKTAKSILISCGSRLAPFDIEEVRDLTAYDELELDTLGDKNQKTVLFIVLSDNDDTFSFLAALMYTQLFNLLEEKADKQYHGRLPVHVRFILDEFANTGKIPNFDRIIASIRSRNMSACPILQSQSQLKGIYKDKMDTIVDNCDSQLFLGGQGRDTLKNMSESLGKETIDLYTNSDSRGTQRSYGFNYNKTGRELASMDVISRMEGDECILRLRGVRPFKSKKFDITQHPYYKYLSDADPANTFHVEQYLNNRLTIRANERYIEFDYGYLDQYADRNVG